MPRLAPTLLREARTKHFLLPSLLRECRDLSSARRELRWLLEHAQRSHGLPFGLIVTRKPLSKEDAFVRAAVWKTVSLNARRRARGEPLQYILGTQPFGDLEILCRKGVLIPRAETEAYASRLGSILKGGDPNGISVSSGDTLRVLDLCTGTGCIPLLLHSILKPVGGKRHGRKLSIVGVDISDDALSLAQENLEHNIGEDLLDLSAASDISFRRASVFELCGSASGKVLEKLDEIGKTFDVVISNPPYIAEKDYRPGGTTTRSVRSFEPKLALVPDLSSSQRTADTSREAHGGVEEHDGDAFYQPLLTMAKKVKASLAIFETGDHAQALRVHQMATAMYKDEACRLQAVIELWDDDARNVELARSAAGCRARSVVIWTGDAMHLRKAERDSER